MDPFTTGALIGLGTKILLNRLAKNRSRDSDNNEISAQAFWHKDTLGEFYTITFTDYVPEGAFAFFRILDAQGNILNGREGFRDDDGDFCVMAEIQAGRCCAYIPFAAPLATEPGDHTLLITIISSGSDGPRLIGHVMFEHEMPDHPQWNYGEYWLPALRLCMYVALADGVLSRGALQAIRRQCVLDDVPSYADDEQMRTSLKRARDEAGVVAGSQLADLVVTFKIRYPQITAYETIEMLVEIGRSDDCMSLKRIEALRRIAEHLDLKDEAWKTLAQAYGLDIDEHLVLLGLSAGATKSEIRAAYLREVRVWHPDRFANSSDTEHLAAERRMCELRRAYESLLALSQ